MLVTVTGDDEWHRCEFANMLYSDAKSFLALRQEFDVARVVHDL